MLPVWMARVVILFFLVLAHAPTVTLTSTPQELCHAIQGAKVSVLAMGVVGDSPGSPISLWVLVEGGHLFALPTTNLQIQMKDKRAKLIIDQDVINATERFNLAKSDFTLKPSYSEDTRFFLITNQNHYGLLARMTQSNKRVNLQTFHLANGTASSTTNFHLNGAISFVGSIWPAEGSTSAHGYQLEFNTETLGFDIKWTVTVNMRPDNELELSLVPYNKREASLMTFTRNVNITSGFFFKVDNELYFLVIDDRSRLTIVRAVHDSAKVSVEQKFQISLSELIECKYPEPPTDGPDLTLQVKPKVTTSGPLMWYHKDRVAFPTESNGFNLTWLGISVAIVLTVVVFCVWWVKRKKNKKAKKAKGGSTCSGIDSSTITYAMFSSCEAKSTASSALSGHKSSVVVHSLVNDSKEESKKYKVDKSKTMKSHKQKVKLPVANGSRIRSTADEDSQQLEDKTETAEENFDSEEVPNEESQLDEYQSVEDNSDEKFSNDSKELEKEEHEEDFPSRVDTSLDESRSKMEDDDENVKEDQYENEPGNKKAGPDIKKGEMYDGSCIVM